MMQNTDGCLPVWILSSFILHSVSVPIAYDHYDVPIYATPRPVPPSTTTATTTPPTTTTRTTTATQTSTTPPTTTTTTTTATTTGITTTTPTTTTRITTTTTTANLPTPSPELYDEEESDDEETLNPGELSPAEKLGQILSAGDVNKLCEAVQPFKNYEMNSQCYNKTGSCSFQSLKYQFPLPKINASTQWNNSTAAEYVKAWLKQNDLSHHIPAICVDDIINTTSCGTTAVGYFYFHVHQAVNISTRIVEIMNVLLVPPKSYCTKLTTAAFHYRQVMACDYPLPLKIITVTRNEASSTSVFAGVVGVSLVVMLCDFMRTFLV